MPESFKLLEEKMVTAPILVFPNWTKKFHVHVYASCIMVGFVITQPRFKDIDHPITFASRKFSSVERNYSTMEREGLAIVYVLIIVSMEKLLKKDASFFWDKDCQMSLEMLKEKMVTGPILVFLEWKK